MKYFLMVFGVVLSITTPLTLHAKLHLFACEPEWAALAQEIGGDRVKTFSATHAKQDPHYIRARPNLIAKARRADIFLCSGAGLESGWLPILLSKTGRNLQPGSVGYLMAADVVPLLEKPKRVDRSLGDIHPQGNPHLHLNPYNILRVATELTQRLSHIDQSHSAFYHQRLRSFTSRWRQAIHRWETMAIPLKNKATFVHHRSFTYLLRWLDVRVIGTLEPKPGIPPSASHLELLLQAHRRTPATMILRTPFDPDDASAWIAQKTGLTAVILPYTVGGDHQSTDLFTLFDRIIKLMLEGYRD